LANDDLKTARYMLAPFKSSRPTNLVIELDYKKLELLVAENNREMINVKPQVAINRIKTSQ